MDFTAEGLNLERLIRQAAEEQVMLRRLNRQGRRVSACVPEKDIPVIARLCEQGGWRFTQGRRHGAGRLMEMLLRRWPAGVMLVLAAAAVIASSMMMWRVEIVNGGSYTADLRQYLDALDITPPRWKSAVDTAWLRDALEWRYPDVAWVEVGWRGMTLHVTLHEGQPMGDTVSLDGCCDVVASRDGIISYIVTLAGTPQVKPGDLVKAGDVLIAGEERGEKESVHPVAARGVVMARVWDGAAVTMSLMEQKTAYTGREQERLSVITPWFPLWPETASDYVFQDESVSVLPLGGLFLPVWVQRTRCMEAEITAVERDLEEVKAEAGLAALRKLRQKVGMSDKLIDKWVEYSMIKDGELQAVAYGERCIDIGQRRDAVPQQ